MPSDAQVAQAVTELKQTTVGYINKNWTVPPAGTHWKNALDLLAPPTPPPPSGVKAIYDNDQNKAADWPKIVSTTGCNTLICGADDPQALAALKAAGGHAWATVGYWNDATGAFSHDDATALAMAKSAVAANPGLINGWYVADEPSMAHSNAPALVAARSNLLRSVLAVETLIAMWDTTIFSNFKGSATAFAIDGYPNRDNFNMRDITDKASFADAHGIRYYGVVGSFTDGGVYLLPTPVELQTMITTWKGTHAVGLAYYEWGPAGGPVDSYLENHPELLAVIKAN